MGQQKCKLLSCGYFKAIILKVIFFVSVDKREFITQYYIMLIMHTSECIAKIIRNKNVYWKLCRCSCISSPWKERGSGVVKEKRRRKSSKSGSCLTRTSLLLGRYRSSSYFGICGDYIWQLWQQVTGKFRDLLGHRLSLQTQVISALGKASA